MYRLLLTDKGNSHYRVEWPEEFLSQKSIDRRKKQGFHIDETDLPIDSAYFEAIAKTGATVQTSSKWLKTIVVMIPDIEIQEKVRELSFVAEMTKVWSGGNEEYERNEENERNKGNERDENKDETDYGSALTQIKINNALLLHQEGYKGFGKTIAVMDAGFKNADIISDFLDLNKVLEAKNFTHEKGDPYRSSENHGTAVLSCILANNQGVMIGTAPFAQFYLFKTEVNGEEYPVEEDYWVAALEYADSLGVDIVTTSLGYSEFKDPEMNHSWDDLDGHTIPASRAASMAASKGMVLFNAAGNEGRKSWQKVIIPADAENILTVGAIRSDSLQAEFSSWGFIENGRIKPDVMAMGNLVCLVSGSGDIYYSNGTSFSTPILAGMGACLWEALPELTSFELMNLIKQFSDRSSHPDEYYGYGIPNIYEAYLYGKRNSDRLSLINNDEIKWGYTDSIRNRLYLKDDKITWVTICSFDGCIVLNQPVSSGFVDIGSLQKGIYVVSAFSNDKRYTGKFIK
ncbi:MAG: S8 family peptidase [Dysgonamonadaceae bacterium]|jgi:subtilisin family serine protease|nr:S8 family peptidase [Dysgonamonadaceae bacterium]